MSEVRNCLNELEISNAIFFLSCVVFFVRLHEKNRMRTNN